MKAQVLSESQAAEIVARACPTANYRSKRVLLIVPDSTRTAPVGLLFKCLHEQMGSVVAHLDILIALGTHQPMSEAAICERLEISTEERRGKYGAVRFFNHEWDNPPALRQVGELEPDEVSELTRRLVLDGGAGRGEQDAVRLRPGHHHRPGLSPRSGRLFGRQ
jgi:lactate racemase